MQVASPLRLGALPGAAVTRELEAILHICSLERDLHFEDLLSAFACAPDPAFRLRQTRRNPSCSNWLSLPHNPALQAEPPPTLDPPSNTIDTISLQALKPSLTDLGNIFGNPDAGLFLTTYDPSDTSVPMTGMARHGSVGAFSGFSVCQPALGASLQWLPAIGTAELDDMINAFLPGPASIQDKRAHISMDFFEFSRQTGENFKFYPAPSGSFTPVAASPATSALYDSGYASSFNHSPVLSDQGSWTQSPAPFAPAASAPKPRSSASKKSSSSSSRQQAVDFASHPGMRILTKDGRDVTNSASRGCKTKEQRDHAHLMRIIKACDACKKKKIRCDPSHRKRNASQSSASQAEQKPAKRAKKTEEPTPVAAVNAATDFTAADSATESLSFPSLDTSYPQDAEEFWNEFVALDQEPVEMAPTSAIDDFLFDSFTDIHSFFSPSSGSTATSPSQILTPVTPGRSEASPATASQYAVGVPGEFSLEDPAVPYLNPGVAHGTNYLDFNLYSPGPDVFDEDPLLQMRDLGSQQHSPQSTSSVAQHSPQISPTSTSAAVSRTTPTGESDGGENHTATTAIHDLAWYYDPGDTLHDKPQPSAHRSPTNPQLSTNHNRVIEDGDGGYSSHRRVDGGNTDAFATSSDQSLVSQSSAPTALYNATSTVVANAPESSVSPNRAPRPRRVTSAPPGGSLASPGRSHVPTKATRSGKLDAQSPKAVAGASYTMCSKSRQLLAHCASGSPTPEEEQHAAPQATAAGNATLATMLFSTLPTRRNVAGEDVKLNAFFFQLAVFGLVSFICASALQAHLANQVNLVNILAITSISLARLAPRCSGPSSATCVASKTLPPPTPSGILNTVKLKIQSVVTGLGDLRSSASRRAISSMPRPPTVRLLRL
ncbi:uncharacterized protein B0H64DRAFT_429403 [Chaetomium fimeti]|uniref:Uncharacterized protein n=1 Tax=Chaetomium fimeti TaxID=1854472 RepID=A0AAE0LUE7_9PEZI|nr:hypothetical protein B0H64DRAFT_429403 [Chaetomium fimeti]